MTHSDNTDLPVYGTPGPWAGTPIDQLPPHLFIAWLKTRTTNTSPNTEQATPDQLTPGELYERTRRQ